MPRQCRRRVACPRRAGNLLRRAARRGAEVDAVWPAGRWPDAECAAVDGRRHRGHDDLGGRRLDFHVGPSEAPRDAARMSGRQPRELGQGECRAMPHATGRARHLGRAARCRVPLLHCTGTSTPPPLGPGASSAAILVRSFVGCIATDQSDRSNTMNRNRMLMGSARCSSAARWVCTS